jgi:quinol-cytochrome oxidoreductase complex cytochrome b subunit
LPFVLAALGVVHMLTIHVHGSSNPLGISSNIDKTPMHPYFLFKDLVTFYVFFLVLAVIVTQYPNLMGHIGPIYTVYLCILLRSQINWMKKCAISW